MEGLILPFCKPMIAHSPVISGVFSILGVNPKANVWLLSNFINLHINTSTKEDQFFSRRLLFENCPWLHQTIVHADQIKPYTSYTSFIIQCIKAHYYCYVVVKTRYIPAYSKKDFDEQACHNLFIYGFDAIERVLYIADHFNDGVYSTATCTIDELESALCAFANANKDYYNIFRCFRMINLNYEFELYPIIRQLEDHLGSVNILDESLKIIPDENFGADKNGLYKYTTYQYRKNNYVFGLDMYDYLIESTKKGFTSKSDLRPFTLLYYHKVLMVKRLDLFVHHNINIPDDLLESATNLVNLSNLMCNHVIKYAMTSNRESCISSICKLLEECKVRETNFTYELLEVLYHERINLKMN